MKIKYHFVVGEKVIVNGEQGTVTKVRVDLTRKTHFEVVNVVFDDGSFDTFDYVKKLEGQGEERVFDLLEEPFCKDTTIKAVTVVIDSPFSCLINMRLSNGKAIRLAHMALEPVRILRYKTISEILGAIIETPRGEQMTVEKIKAHHSSQDDITLMFCGKESSEGSPLYCCMPEQSVKVVDGSNAEDAVIAIPEIRDDMKEVTTCSDGVISYIPVHRGRESNFRVKAFPQKEELSAF